jgi:GNAT superfamily N-acetyltransferase
MASALTLRALTEGDVPFLLRVYEESREEELAPVPWSPEEKKAFLAMQFEAQHKHYKTHYPEASFDVAEWQDEPIGRLYVGRGKADIRIVDIAFAKAHRGHGHGTSLLVGLLEEGRARAVPVTIHVERQNPAHRLYMRLGFRALHENGIYLFMEWRADAAPQEKSAS